MFKRAWVRILTPDTNWVFLHINLYIPILIHLIRKWDGIVLATLSSFQLSNKTSMAN